MDKAIELQMLSALIKALLPFDAGDLTDCDMGLDGAPSLYDTFENACCHHYELTHNGQRMPKDLPIEDYAKTLPV